jgi:hypothetical protein
MQNAQINKAGILLICDREHGCLPLRCSSSVSVHSGYSVLFCVVFKCLFLGSNVLVINGHGVEKKVNNK